MRVQGCRSRCPGTTVSWRQRVRSQGRGTSEIAAAMNAVNPRFIPRNHRIEQASEGKDEDRYGHKLPALAPGKTGYKEKSLDGIQVV